MSDAQVALEGAINNIDQHPVKDAHSLEGAASAAQSADLQAARQHLLNGFAQVALAMMNVPRYRHHTLAELERLIMEPLLQDRIAIASARSEAVGTALIGIAIWASVSDEVDAKIKEQIKAGVFPIRLTPSDWRSGSKAWLLDVIAPNRKLSTAVLLKLSAVMQTDQVSLHPLVSAMVDPEVLKRMVQPAPDVNDRAV